MDLVRLRAAVKSWSCCHLQDVLMASSQALMLEATTSLDLIVLLDKLSKQRKEAVLCCLR